MIFEVNIEDTKLENYEKILSRFDNWKKYKREIFFFDFDLDILNS